MGSCLIAVSTRRQQLGCPRLRAHRTNPPSACRTPSSPRAQFDVRVTDNKAPLASIEGEGGQRGRLSRLKLSVRCRPSFALCLGHFLRSEPPPQRRLPRQSWRRGIASTGRTRQGKVFCLSNVICATRGHRHHPRSTAPAAARRQPLNACGKDLLTRPAADRPRQPESPGLPQGSRSKHRNRMTLRPLMHSARRAAARKSLLPRRAPTGPPHCRIGSGVIGDFIRTRSTHALPDPVQTRRQVVTRKVRRNCAHPLRWGTSAPLRG